MNRADIPQAERIKQMLDDQRPLVYVASDYSHPHPAIRAHNVKAAQQFGAQINASGLAFAVLPLNCSIGLIASMPPRQWYAMTLALALKCEALIAMRGKGVGRLDELHALRTIGVPTLDMNEDASRERWRDFLRGLAK